MARQHCSNFHHNCKSVIHKKINIIDDINIDEADILHQEDARIDARQDVHVGGGIEALKNQITNSDELDEKKNCI
jgi:hypothetical protein